MSLIAEKMRNLVIGFELVLLQNAGVGTVDSAILLRVQRAFRLDIISFRYVCQRALLPANLLS